MDTQDKSTPNNGERIVHNEQKLIDIEVPMSILEEKMDKLEQQMQQTTMQDMDLITESVCKRIEKKANMLLPSFMKPLS